MLLESYQLFSLEYLPYPPTRHLEDLKEDYRRAIFDIEQQSFAISAFQN